MTSITRRSAMPLTESVRAVALARRADDVVITTMGVAREWMAMAGGALGSSLDLVLVPSCMGHATSFGLGLALAQPKRRVIVCNGDGSMLMNLGSLVSITAAAPPNLTLLVFDNGVYEVTGAQPTPGSPAGRSAGTDNRHGGVDFTGLARASGFRSVHHYETLEPWTKDVARLLAEPGPTFVALDVESIPGTPGPRSPGPAGERAKRFMAALQG